MAPWHLIWLWCDESSEQSWLFQMDLQYHTLAKAMSRDLPTKEGFREKGNNQSGTKYFQGIRNIIE